MSNDGRPYLQCSLCEHSWIYAHNPRTHCKFCWSAFPGRSDRPDSHAGHGKGKGKGAGSKGVPNGKGPKMQVYLRDSVHAQQTDEDDVRHLEVLIQAEQSFLDELNGLA
eukprot:262966-Pyramimonas_sp.AAC.1